MNRWKLAGWLALALVIAGAAYSTAETVNSAAAAHNAAITAAID